MIMKAERENVDSGRAGMQSDNKRKKEEDRREANERERESGQTVGRTFQVMGRTPHARVVSGPCRATRRLDNYESNLAEMDECRQPTTHVATDGHSD